MSEHMSPGFTDEEAFAPATDPTVPAPVPYRPEQLFSNYGA